MSTVIQTRWTVKQLEDLTLELLGELLGEDPDSLRGHLIKKGAAMPVDSLDMFDILKDFHKRTGLKIPKRQLRRQTLKSVRTFAEFVAREARS
jgi:acyl carrier protein